MRVSTLTTCVLLAASVHARGSRAVIDLDASAALYRSLSRTECHSSIASQLKSSCGGWKAGEDSMSEADKRGVAISFTLCSMQSALQAIPSECFPWSPHVENPDDHRAVQRWIWPSKKNVPEEQQQTLCLGALHRSPQDWTSYNGFLSDATQLCYALNGQREANLARQMYANATAEKIALLKHLKRREDEREARDERLEEQLTERQQKFHAASISLEHTQQRLKEGLDQHLDLLRELRVSVELLEAGGAALWEGVERDMKEQVKEAGGLLDKQLASVRDDWIQQMTMRLKAAVDLHDHALVVQTEKVNSAVQALLTDLVAQSNSVSDYTNSQLATMRTSWEATFQLSDDLGKGIRSLSSDIVPMRAMVAESHDAAVTTTNLQQEHAQAIAASSKQVQSLSAGLHKAEEILVNAFDVIEAKTISLAKAQRWSPTMSLFSAPALISLGGRDWDFLGVALRCALLILGVSWQLLCYVLSAVCCLVVIPRTRLRQPLVHVLERAVKPVEDEERPTPG
ncbi:hypothetical protein IAT38_002325 [Cryptococcus sp. DSM 104549]